MEQVGQMLSKNPVGRAVGAAAYLDKTPEYFGEARYDIVALLPADQEARILEIGCGNGATGREALASGKAGTYVGVELSPEMAEEASRHLSKVFTGNVEEMEPDALGRGYDVLILSEVLEHLNDPWFALNALAGCVRPGGKLYCSSPNISSKAIISALVRGHFNYQSAGPMDRTHLRWFTPRSYLAMIEAAGFKVISCGPVAPFSKKANLFNRLTGNRFRHLFMTQIFVVGEKC